MLHKSGNSGGSVLDYVTVEDQSGIVYTMVHARLDCYRKTIRGRGTTCWTVQNDDRDTYLVKNSRKNLGRVDESTFLKMIVDIDSVGQMRLCQNRLALLSELRLIDIDKLNISDEVAKLYHDREMCRIVLEYYGRSLEEFKSRGEFLRAYHDALCGYHNLYKAGILHRDISVNNVLIGKSGASSPNRGVIIDMDMAIELERTYSLHEVNFMTGTRAFQSINILRSYKKKNKFTPHSYMDDLESFFYVLCWVCCGYSAPGRRIEDFSSAFADWEHHTAKQGADVKTILYVQPFQEQVELSVTDYFGDAFLVLVDSLHEFFQSYVTYDKDFKGKRPPPTLDSAMETILGHVKTALACVEAEEAADSVVRPAEDGVPSATPEPANPQSVLLDDMPRVYCTRASSRASSKRGYDESSEGDESTSAKKLRPHPHAPRNPSSLGSSSLARGEP